MAHSRVVIGQVPTTHGRFASGTHLKGGRRLVLEFDGRALQAGRRAAARREVDVRAPDQRPRVRRLDRAADVAVHLQLWAEFIAQTYSWRIVPVMLADLAASGGIGDVAFAAGVNQVEASGQPQVGHQFQVIAGMQHVIRALVTEITGFGTDRVDGGISGWHAHEFR
ncbi:hypothetical protein D3C80_1110030 [compost metagenome]